MAGEHQGTPNTLFGRIIIYRAQYWNHLNYYDNPIDDPFKLYIDAYKNDVTLNDKMTKDQIKLDIEDMMHAMSWGDRYFIGTPRLYMQCSEHKDTHGWRELVLSSLVNKDKTIRYVYYTQPSSIYDVRFNDIYAGPKTLNEFVFNDILSITHSGRDPIPLKRFLEDNVEWVRNDAEKWFEVDYHQIMKQYGPSTKVYLSDEVKKSYEFILKCFKEAYMYCKDALCNRYVPKAIVG